MSERIVLATNHGVITAQRGANGWNECDRALPDRNATSVIAREGVALVGTTEGIYRSEGDGHWHEASSGLDIRHVRWMAYHPKISDREFAGTEPAGIFVSTDGGGAWQGCPEVEELRDRFSWFLPYSPEAGCVRGFAFHGDRGYAAVEVGGVLRSDDRGGTWRLAGGSTGEPVFGIPPAPQVHADVHSVAGHPSSPDLVFAVTAEGLYRSMDGGDSWRVTHGGSYCRAAWVDPDDAEHIILSPADSVASKNGRIEETRDGGRSWDVVSDGLALPWPDRMVERFMQIEDELMAVTNDGKLFGSSVHDLRWQPILPEVEGVNAVAAL